MKLPFNLGDLTSAVQTNLDAFNSERKERVTISKDLAKSIVLSRFREEFKEEIIELDLDVYKNLLEVEARADFDKFVESEEIPSIPDLKVEEVVTESPFEIKEEEEKKAVEGETFTEVKIEKPKRKTKAKSKKATSTKAESSGDE